jgi:hypothetical protein
MTGRERTVAAALAITFDDRAVRRHLVLRHPGHVERARVALDVVERRSRQEDDDDG